MADEDGQVLPAYIEEDEKEAAVAKERRRQQSTNAKKRWPWEFATPEEEAKNKARLTMLDKLYEHDPKTGHGSYIRAWFLDPSFDLDAETQYGPMRHTDSIISDDHRLRDSLNVLCLKIVSSDVGYPINVYGTVIVRDRLDFKCVNIFRRDRIHCQHISSKNEDLILTGPTRGLFYTGEAFFEINLKIKEDEECNDRQFSKALIDVLLARNPKIRTRTVPSRLSEAQLVCAYVKNALEGTFEIKILSGPEVFYGNITACTPDVPNNILLYDSDVGGGMAVADDGIVRLFRRVVAVSEDEMLILNIDARGGDLNRNISRCISKFTPRIKGADEEEVTCGLYKIRVKVTWSTVHVPFE